MPSAFSPTALPAADSTRSLKKTRKCGNSIGSKWNPGDRDGGPESESIELVPGGPGCFSVILRTSPSPAAFPRYNMESKETPRLKNYQ